MIDRREAMKLTATALSCGMIAPKVMSKVPADPFIPTSQFFTREQCRSMRNGCLMSQQAMSREDRHHFEWDFVTAEGETIKEKYEDLYMTVYKLSNAMKDSFRNPRLFNGPEWLVTGPEIASIFETATAGFHPAPFDRSRTDYGVGIEYVGTINARWRLYKDCLAPLDKILLGRGVVGSWYCNVINVKDFF